MMPKRLFASALGALSLVPSAFALIDSGFSHDQLALMRQRLIKKTQASWEYGTACEAFLELDFADVSVYGWNPFPPPRVLDASDYPISTAQYLINNKPVNTAALMDDGAAGDPMSNGIAVILANYTFPDDPRYYNDFQSQLNFIMNVVPRTSDGAISHRVSEVQLWADSVSMVPPVLAYYGALQTDPDEAWKYLTEAYNQIKLYRQYLRDPDVNNGIWKHVVLGSWEDQGHWATGQGWAASGILRVYQTLAKSAYRDSLQWALDDLAAWAEEIVAATWSYQKDDGSLWNYVDRPDSFMDLSSTSFMAAVTYRLALITNANQHIPNADKAFALVKANIASDGRLQNVVNPYNFSDQYYDVSPEGQAMALMLQAAFRDFQSFGNDITDSIGNVLSAFADIVAAAKANYANDSADTRKHRMIKKRRSHH